MLKVYGASEDLIEIDGDISEEFARYDSKGDYLAFSDGTVLWVVYDDDGIWRLTALFKGALYRHKDEGDVEKDITDVVHFDTGIKWVVCGPDLAR